MLQETLQAPDAVARQLAADAGVYADLTESLRNDPPRGLLTLARGSSDHAAHYFAYLVMARLGRLVTSLPMSVVTLYGSALQEPGVVSIAFSQSGQSPDLIVPTQRFRQAGFRTVAIVNDENSPLAQAAAYVCPLRAGLERSVAATKSFIAQLVAGARLVAAWQQEPAWAAAIHALPAVLERAASLRFDATFISAFNAAVDTLQAAERLYVIGRGTGLAVAQELALKFKETCGIQAEAFSGAELRHGPMALVGPGYPLLVLAPRGPAQAGLFALAAEMQQRGAQVLLAAPMGAEVPGGITLFPLVTAPHEDLDPIAAVQSLYPMIEALSRARGRDPDAPPHLAKVTRTR